MNADELVKVVSNAMANTPVTCPLGDEARAAIVATLDWLATAYPKAGWIECEDAYGRKVSEHSRAADNCWEMLLPDELRRLAREVNHGL